MSLEKVDPRTLGARCDQCPLKHRIPVPCQRAKGKPKLVIVGDGPGVQSEGLLRPFVGGGGYHLDRALKVCGSSRSKQHLTHAALCAPAHNHKMQPKEWLTVLDCCRERLVRELASVRCRTVLALGARSLYTFTNKSRINEWAGAPLRGTKEFASYKVMPSFHPALALRKNPAETPVFQTFVQRALDMSAGTLEKWKWPELVWEPPGYIRDVLTRIERSSAAISIDIETVCEQLDETRMRVLGMGCGKDVVSIPWERDLDADIYQQAERIIGSDRVKIFQNGAHDVIVLEYLGIPVGGEFFDTMLAHAAVAPQLRHGLSYMCAIEYPAPRWKTEHKIVKNNDKISTWFEKAGLDELCPYNGKDVYMTDILASRLRERLDTTDNGWEIFNTFTALAKVSFKMKSYGIHVDREALRAHDKRCQELMTKAEAKFHSIVPEGFELGKSGQSNSLKDLFFEYYKIEPKTYTDTGEPQLDEAVLKEHIMVIGRPEAKAAADAVLAYRKAAKVLSVYVRGLSVDTKDMLHPDWWVHGTKTGRWSSASPNMQNQPKALRNIITPRKEGNYIVAADFSQLELRIVALLADAQKLLQYYRDGVDVHTATAQMLFGDMALTKEPKLRAKLRTLAKNVEYGFNYNISNDVTAVWKSLVRTFPELTISRLKRYRKAWLNEHPEIRTWQIKTIKEAEALGYVHEPFSKRRVHFFDGNVDPNVTLNHPVQGFAGYLTNQATLAVNEEIQWGTEFIAAQVHDAIYLEGPDPDRLADILKRGMTQVVTFEGRTMDFPVDVSVGRNMRDLEDV